MIKQLNNYFHINNSSLSREICQDIIKTFESEQGKEPGSTFGGVNVNIKDTVDFNIPLNNKWSRIRKFLGKELDINIKKYVSNINNTIRNSSVENSDHEYSVFTKFVSHETLMVQRYTKNKGRYIYHDDFHNDFDNKKYRVITYLWYLNDVEEGGETEFWGEYKIKPEAGKLILFPASWTFPHRGQMPVSSDKYIITGWVYY